MQKFYLKSFQGLCIIIFFQDDIVGVGFKLGCAWWGTGQYSVTWTVFWDLNALLLSVLHLTFKWHGSIMPYSNFALKFILGHHICFVFFAFFFRFDGAEHIFQVMTTCNNTKDELLQEVEKFNKRRHTMQDLDQEEGSEPSAFHYPDHIRTYPTTIMFGGMEGSLACTVAFLRHWISKLLHLCGFTIIHRAQFVDREFPVVLQSRRVAFFFFLKLVLFLCQVLNLGAKSLISIMRCYARYWIGLAYRDSVHVSHQFMVRAEGWEHPSSTGLHAPVRKILFKVITCLNLGWWLVMGALNQYLFPLYFLNCLVIFLTGLLLI